MRIRNKVIISILNNGEILLSEGYDPVRDFKFYIPIGGGVEFGESIQEAADRELREEIGLESHELKFEDFYESFFEFKGKKEHEVMFHYSCIVSDKTRISIPTAGEESDGEVIPLIWLSKPKLAALKESIIPQGIYDALCRKL